MKFPSRRQWRCPILLFLLFGLPLALVSGLTLGWIQHLGTLDRTIGDQQDQLARYQRLLRTLPELRQELERVRNNEAFRSFYIDAPTAALAGAQVQRQMQDLITAADARLISSQLLPEQPGEVPARIRVRTQIQGSTEGLLEILWAVERARPLLFVEQLSIRSTARPDLPVPGRSVRRPPHMAGDLTIRLDIFGFALGHDS